MKTKNIGIIFVIIGLIMMIYTGFNYITTKKVVDIGAVKIDKEENHPVRWSPIVGAALLLGGILVIAVGKD
jgi:uncharacterized membrane protein YdcZ (DUF606 family)